MRHSAGGMARIPGRRRRKRPGPLRRFVRLPQEGQPAERLRDGLATPQALLDEARGYWRKLARFRRRRGLAVAGALGEFLRACARNICKLAK